MTRKTIIAMVCIIMTALLYGCGPGSAANTIQPWDTEDEQARAAIDIVTDADFRAFAAFDVDETYQTVEMGIEYYKDGKLVEDESQGSASLYSEGDAKASSGIAGFVFNNGKITMGASVAGESSVRVGDVELTGFEDGDDEALGFVPISEAQDIRDGSKIYLGIINSGDEVLDTSILTDPAGAEKLQGKNWLPYVVFTGGR